MNQHCTFSSCQALSEESIALLAYKKWDDRRYGRGSALQDWMVAEAELNLLKHSSEEVERLSRTIAGHILRKHRLQQRLRVEHEISRILTGARTLADAAPLVLAAICDGLRCREARLVIRVDDGEDSQYVAVWPARMDLRNAESSAMPKQDGITQSGQHNFPIQLDADCIGSLQLVSHSSSWRAPVLRMLNRVGRQIAQFVARLRLENELGQRNEDRRIARIIQQGLLPRTAPTSEGFTIAGKLLAAGGVGGDYFDFINMTANGRSELGVVVADASGHGIASALMISAVRAYLRALSLTCGDVETLLELTNKSLFSDSDSDQLVTLLMLKIDPATRSLVYSNAGHWPGYVLDWRGKQKALLASSGFPLGIAETNHCPSGRVALEPGDIVFLFTDGITEAAEPDGTLFGARRAVDVVRANRHQRPQQILDALFEEVLGFCGGNLLDDMTAVVIKAEERDSPWNTLQADSIK